MFFTDRILAAPAALEIDRIEGFFSPSKRASYAGLVPSTYASGGAHRSSEAVGELSGESRLESKHPVVIPNCFSCSLDMRFH